MKTYHLVWLKAHPHRSERWLIERLKDGFDIHHIDGDKGNEDPKNLVLIECTDHLMLHGSTANRLKMVTNKGKKYQKKGPLINPVDQWVEAHGWTINTTDALQEVEDRFVARSILGYTGLY